MGDLGGAFAAFESAAAVVKRDFHGGVCDTLNAMASQVSGLMGSFSGFCAQGKAEVEAQAKRLKTLFPKGLDGLDEEMRNFEREIGWNDRTGSFTPPRGSSRPSAGHAYASSSPTSGLTVATPSSRMTALPTASSRPTSASIPSRPPMMRTASPSSASTATAAGARTPATSAMTTSHSSSSSTTPVAAPAVADKASSDLAKKYAEGWNAYVGQMLPALCNCGIIATLRGQIGASLDEIARITVELNRLSVTRLDKRAVDAKNRELASLGTQLQLKRRLVEECLGDLPKNDSWMASVKGNLDLAQKELSDVEAWLKIRPAWAEERHQTVDGFRKRFAQISGDRTALEARLKRQKASCDRIAQTISSLQSSLSDVVAAENARVAKIASEKARGEALCRDAGNAYRKLNPKTALRFSLAQVGGRWVSSPSKAEFFRELDSVEAPLVRLLEARAKLVGELQTTVALLSPSDINETDAFPSYVIVDSCAVSISGRRIDLPVPTSFPFKKPRYFRDPSEIEPFLLRLICALPVGSVQITMLDIEKKGDNGRVFNSLARTGQNVFRLVTDISDLGGVLKEHGSYIASLASSGKFTATVGDWAAYNAAHSRNPLPFRILVVHSLHGWDERDVDDLADLFVRGPASGVHVFFALDGMDTLDERVRAKVATWPTRATTSPVDVVKWAKEGGVLKPVRIPMRLPSPTQVEKILDAYVDHAEKRSARAAHVFADLFAGTPVWSASSIDGLEAPVGWDESGNQAKIQLGDINPHAFIGGPTGGGKSNLIHVILCSLCHRYSPEELQIYLLDMKDGAEAFMYVDRTSGKAWLPHARAILASNSPHFAKTFLERVAKEIENRNNLFKSDGANNISAWRSKSGKRIPRILFVADEFTQMFANADTARGMSDTLRKILQLGRSAGIHVLVATQTADSLTDGNAAVILDQLGLRFALPKAASGVLATGNHGADTLSVPQCVLNPFKGKDEDKNQIFVHPRYDTKATPSDAERFRREMDSAVAKMMPKQLPTCMVINSVDLRQIPPTSEFRSQLGPEPSGKAPRFNLLLGKEDSFDGGPFRILLDCDYAKDNVLVSSGKDRKEPCGIWNGLRMSVLCSLSALSDKRVLLYDPTRDDHPFPKSSAWLDFCGGDATEDDVKRKLEALRDCRAKHRILVIENLEYSKILVPVDDPYGLGGSADADSSLGILCSAFKTGRSFGVILFTHDVLEVESRIGSKGMDALLYRIAFGYSSTKELRGIIGGTDMLDNPGSSVFYDEKAGRGSFITILPFVQPPKKP